MFSHTIFGGQKDKWLVAFYGYGQSASVYKKLYALIQDSYNVLIVDNPMHDYEFDIYPEDFANYLNETLAQLGVEEFIGLSYSMGSRLNLYLPEFFPSRLKKIILIAPDGIATNFWNRAAVGTPWGRKLFYIFTKPGNLYLNTLLFFHKIGIVNKSLYAFSKWNMRDEQRRKNVYNAWMNMRLMRPDLHKVNAQIEKHNIPMLSFFGNHDPVITTSIQQKCAESFPSGKHIIVNSDHNILTPIFFNQLAQEILQ